MERYLLDFLCRFPCPANSNDGENRMTRLTSPDGTVITSTYGGGGLRRTKQEPGQGVTTFVWDGSDYLGERLAMAMPVTVYTSFGGEIFRENRGAGRSGLCARHPRQHRRPRGLRRQHHRHLGVLAVRGGGGRTGTSTTPFTFAGTLGYFKISSTDSSM